MRNLKLLIILSLTALMYCCKKDNSEIGSKVSMQLYYRLSIVKTTGDTTFSQTITTKALTTERGTPLTDGGNGSGNDNGNGNGQCNNPAGHNNCKCDEKSPDFCAKHPCHWKCRLLGSTILQYFQVRLDSEIPTIFWETTDESQIQSIILTRSIDSYNFKSIYKVVSKQTPRKYQYTDK